MAEAVTKTVPVQITCHNSRTGTDVTKHPGQRGDGTGDYSCLTGQDDLYFIFGFNRKMNFKHYFLIILLSTSPFLSCDRFTGYDLEEESIQQTARIHGQVINTFTGSPVISAQVTMETFTTFSDGRGEYTLIYLLRADEIRNRPVRVEVTAENYLPYSGEFVLYPPDTQFDVSLDYAAPIIRKNVLVFFGPENLLICQALIIDYQGVHTLSSVTTKFYYHQVSTNLTRVVESAMEPVILLSDTSVFYQGIINSIIDGDWMINLKNRYQIIASDVDGYIDHKYDFYKSGVIVDTLLFPPVIP